MDETQKALNLELIRAESDLPPIERADFDGEFARDVKFHLDEEMICVTERFSAVVDEIEIAVQNSNFEAMAPMHAEIAELSSRLNALSAFVLLNFDRTAPPTVAEAS